MERTAFINNKNGLTKTAFLEKNVEMRKMPEKNAELNPYNA